MDKLNEYEGHYDPETLKDRLLGVYTVGDGKGYELTREFPESVTPISREAVYRIGVLEAENERLTAEIEKLKRIEQKAFWWSAEFTDICHDRKIQSSWEDWRENFRDLVQ